MKGIITTILIIIILLTMLGISNTVEAHYNREVVVTDVDCIEVTVEDEQGHLWSFFGSDYRVGQQLTVVMYDNHTDSITDDEIVRVKQ
jgi:hypothetical protein